jgi:hypothetical protein
MKLIAHRGNTNGSNPLKENNPDYINYALSKGYDAEIDIRYDKSNERFYLGHDGPDYLINWSWLEDRKEKLWIHCKNLEALYVFSCSAFRTNYFWHQNDDFTLTSENYIWTYPGKSYTPRSIIVMPETIIGEEIRSIKAYNCFGVCSDYVGQLT